MNGCRTSETLSVNEQVGPVCLRASAGNILSEASRGFTMPVGLRILVCNALLFLLFRNSANGLDFRIPESKQ
jgi:hypothetical protein